MPEGTPGAIWLRGRVLDGAGEPVPDALVETWQADPDGRFDHPDDPRGRRRLPRLRPLPDRRRRALARSSRVKPGRVPGRRRAAGAAHRRRVFARGLLDRVVTRIYFADEPAANAADPVLARLCAADAARRCSRSPPTTATASTSTSRATRETVFFAV